MELEIEMPAHSDQHQRRLRALLDRLADATAALYDLEPSLAVTVRMCGQEATCPVELRHSRRMTEHLERAEQERRAWVDDVQRRAAAPRIALALGARIRPFAASPVQHDQAAGRRVGAPR
jgi:hypothetical protein